MAQITASGKIRKLVLLKPETSAEVERLAAGMHMPVGTLLGLLIDIAVSNAGATFEQFAGTVANLTGQDSVE